MISVIVADDDAAIRSALGLALKQKLSIENLSEAANMEELLAKAREAGPALILLDWELPGLATQGGLAMVLRQNPCLKVVALSARPEARQAAMAAGADAFVSKTEPPDTMMKLVDALRVVPPSRK